MSSSTSYLFTISNKFYRRIVTMMNEVEIQSILKEVSTENLKQYLNKLSSFHTRHSKSPLLNDASNWIMNKVKDFGYSNANYYPLQSTIENEEFELRNIVCKKRN